MDADQLQLLEGLLDREAIRQLPILYCHYVRQRDYAAILDLFTDDAEINIDAKLAPRGTASGRAELETIFRESLDIIDPWPFVHNHVIELMGDGTAKGTVYAEFRLGSEKLRTSAIGVYTDHYVRVSSGAWLFQSRKLISTPIPS